jgi:hypothetical protein
VHFLVLGAALFALHAVLDETPPPVAGTVLVVTDADAARMAQRFEATWGRPPGPDELDDLIQQHVREEVYVREARALGLDRDDAIVRRRLQQKMEFLADGAGEVPVPTDAELRAHLESHPERFERQTVVGFEQVPLSPATGREGADEVLGALLDGAGPDDVGMPSFLPTAFRPSPRAVIDGAFGEGFFAAVVGLERGTWSGPIPSAHGVHLVRVTDVVPGGLPRLEQIRDEVERDWRASLGERMREARYLALLSRYDVRLPDPAVVLGR